jgi:hypothetical protein
MSESETTFNLEYILSVCMGLGAAFVINANQPTFSPVLSFFVVPLLVCFISLKIFNYIFPKMNTAGSNTSSYLQYGVTSSLANMGYMEIFPPLFAVLILVVILLYNRNLG